MAMAMDAVIPTAGQDPSELAWQQLAPLHLKLGERIHLVRHSYRQQPWLIVADQQRNKYFRGSIDYEPFVRLLDGDRSVEQALADANAAASNALTRQDVVTLVANLKSAGLLQIAGPDQGLLPDAPATGASKLLQALMKPFSIRLRLVDPDDWLDATAPYLQWIQVRWLLPLWFLLVVVSLYQLVLHWSGLIEHAQSRFGDPANLLHYWLLYPLLKILHELAHAFTTKRWGGQVREMGIILLVFFPVPYVDSSAAHGFDHRYQRLLVSAAGIMAEVLMACLALWLWTSSDPGLLRDLAFDVMIIGGVSTLLFNANPLLRFDGYYILSEWIQIPNLALRSNRYIGYLFERYLLAIHGSRSPVTARGEPGWLFTYGLASNAYRVFVTFAIAVWVSGKLFIVGVTLAVWAVLSQLLWPIAKGSARLYATARDAARLPRLILIMTSAVIVVGLVLLTPIGHRTVAQGIINLPDDAEIRATTDGIIEQVHVADGELVSAGGSILSLRNIELQTRARVVDKQIAITRSRMNNVALRDRAQKETLQQELDDLQAELLEIKSRLDGLEISTDRAGRIVLPSAADLPGRFIRKGDLVAYRIHPGPLTASIVIDQADVRRVLDDTRSILLRTASQPDQLWRATLRRELPVLTDRLPSRYLGTGAGGDVAVDQRDQTGHQTISRVYQVELALPRALHSAYFGQRIFARFEHSQKSLAQRFVQYLQYLWRHERN